MAATNNPVVIHLLTFIFGIGLILGSYVGMRHMRAPPRTFIVAFVLVNIIPIGGIILVSHLAFDKCHIVCTEEVFYVHISYLCEWLVIAKVYTLLLIAMERYYDVIDPVVCDHAYLGQHKLLAVAVTWIGSAVMALFSPTFQASMGSRMDFRLINLNHLALLMIVPAGTLVFSYYHMRRHVRHNCNCAVEMLHRGRIHDVHTLVRWSVRLNGKISHKLRLLMLTMTSVEIYFFLYVYWIQNDNPWEKIPPNLPYGGIELFSAPIIFALMTAHIACLKSDVRNQVKSHGQAEMLQTARVKSMAELRRPALRSAASILGDAAVHPSAPPSAPPSD